MNPIIGVMLITAFASSTTNAVELNYPARQITAIVPYAAGGGTDTIARIIGRHLSDKVGQQVIVDNRPGGNTIIGTQIVAKAKSDGYTMVFVTITHAVNASMISKLPYDSVKDFTPIIQIYAQPLVVVVHPSFPVKTIKELIDLARKKPNLLSFSSSGDGGAPHLAGELFKKMASIKMEHIPFKGAAPASISIIAGHIPLMFGPVVTVGPYIKSGRLYPLAVTTNKRLQPLPQIPTVAESGLPNYNISSWTGILFPANTANMIVDRMNSEIQKILETSEVKERLILEGAEIVGGSSDDFSRFLKSEIDKWKTVFVNSKI